MTKDTRDKIEQLRQQLVTAVGFHPDSKCSVLECLTHGGKTFVRGIDPNGYLRASCDIIQDLVAQPAPSQDSDSIVMPKELTAKNGAKHAFMGEFHEDTAFGATGKIIRVPISWTTIKEIYKKAVELFGEPVQSPRPRDDKPMYRIDENGNVSIVPSVPEGYVLVPVEPTEEMMRAFHHDANSCDENLRDVDRSWYKDVWRILLAAAPKSDGGA